MHIEIHGRRDADAPTLVFSSGLGGAAHFWMPQLDALTSDYRVVLYDQLGTGKSPATLPTEYSIDAMASELRTLLASLRLPSDRGSRNSVLIINLDGGGA